MGLLSRLVHVRGSKVVLICMVGLAVLSARSALAVTSILDPKNVLTQVREYLGQRLFTDVFRCGDQAFWKIFTISCESVKCTKDGCIQVCTTVADPGGLRTPVMVANCFDDGVQLFFETTGDLRDIRRADYERGHQNVAEWFLGYIGELTGYVEAHVILIRAEPVKYKLSRGTPQEREIDALNIFAEFGEPGTSQLGVVLTVARDAPGAGQVLRFRLDRSSWFLVDDFNQR